MSIYGINGYIPPRILPGGTRTTGNEGSPASDSKSVGKESPRPAEAAGRTSRSIPTEAPEGTDPMLWSVLTAEERSFFARARAMGQVTYGPQSGSASTGVPRGGRIDVRV